MELTNLQSRKIGKARALFGDASAVLKYAPVLPLSLDAIVDRCQRAVDQASAGIKELQEVIAGLAPVKGVDPRD